MITLAQLVKSFDPTANPATVLRGTGRWETEGPSLLPTVSALVFGAAVPVDISATSYLQITLTSNAAFQFSAPTGPTAPALVVLRIINTSGGAHGAGTFAAGWNVAGNVTAIATANNRSYLFLWTGAAMYEIVRGAADIPN